MAGLHGISADRLGRQRARARRGQPSRAAAHAASQPAWPAPMTITSTSCRSRRPHFPTQNRSKNMLAANRPAFARPVISSSACRAAPSRPAPALRWRRRRIAVPPAQRQPAPRRAVQGAGYSKCAACRATLRDRQVQSRSPVASRSRPTPVERGDFDGTRGGSSPDRRVAQRARQVRLRDRDDARSGRPADTSSRSSPAERQTTHRARQSSSAATCCACRARSTPSASIASVASRSPAVSTSVMSSPADVHPLGQHVPRRPGMSVTIARAAPDERVEQARFPGVRPAEDDHQRGPRARRGPPGLAGELTDVCCESSSAHHRACSRVMK